MQGYASYCLTGISTYALAVHAQMCRPASTEHKPPSLAAMQTEETDYEAAVEMSQSLRSNMQREARLSYKFEVR